MCYTKIILLLIIEGLKLMRRVC